MRVALILGVLLILAVNAAALAPATVPFRPYLTDATLALSVLVLIGLLLPARQQPPLSKPQAEPAGAALPAPAAAHADAEIVSFLAMLQEKGRLVDFLMDDINPYNDAQVGTAARVIHAGCKRVLQEHFSIHPLRSEDEGSTVRVPAGYATDEYRLVGKIAGQAPFSGVLVHRGWKTDMVKLPQLLPRAPGQLPAIAPAEVELK
jgi:Domain of unknown function (DUF2760)